MNDKKKPVYLPLTHALAWIVASTLLISGTSHVILKHFLANRKHRALDAKYAICSMIQTGPQREALKTEYLAELIGISSDHPLSALTFNLNKAKQRLLRSPLISEAEVKLIKPSTLYVDYTVRRPIAWLEDFTNIVLDKQGYPFPFSPFFSPKNLPAIYFGLSSADSQRPTVQWGEPMHGKYVELALAILAIVTDPKVADLFFVKRIDVSNAFAESYGTREIVIITEDTMICDSDGKEVQFCLPRTLRLSTKNYAQELGNYLKLRPQLLEGEKKISSIPDGSGPIVRLKEKIIDFRVQQLAFIE
jgi:cell division septal protein FtsQ